MHADGWSLNIEYIYENPLFIYTSKIGDTTNMPLQNFNILVYAAKYK